MSEDAITRPTETMEARLMDVFNSHGLRVDRITFEPDGETEDGRFTYTYTIETEEMNL